MNSAEALNPAASSVFLYHGYSDSFEQVYDLNKQQLINGIPPIVLVDTFYLPYRREYQKIHASHSAIFAGFNKDSICMIDFYPPHYFKGFVEYNSYKKSRNSLNPKDVNPFSGIPIMNYWYHLNIDKLTDSEKECILINLLDVVKKTSDSKKELRREDALMYLYIYFIKCKNASICEKKMIMSRLHDSLFVYQNASNMMIYYFQTLRLLMQIPEEVMESLEKLNQCLVQFNTLCMRGSVSKNPSSYDNLEKLFLKLIRIQAVFLKNMDTWLSGFLLLNTSQEGEC